MELTGRIVGELFEQEISRFKNHRAAAALEKLAVPVRVEDRAWDYGKPGQTFPCWIVADDPDSMTSFAYCQFGFGPSAPWGLLNMSKPGTTLEGSIGMDCGWFRTLEDAFLDSYPGAEFERPSDPID